MAQQIIENGESGLVVRNKLNSMFTELYGNTPVPMKVLGAAGNTIVTVPGNVYVPSIEVVRVSGTPLLKIGKTPGGEEYLPEVPITGFQPATVQDYFAEETPIYFTLSGGVINIRVDVINNYF